MSKKYQHKNPHITDPLLRIENAALRTKLQNATKENNKLEIALRMLTGTKIEKADLLAAIERLHNSNSWWVDVAVGATGLATAATTYNVPVTIQPITIYGGTK